MERTDREQLKKRLNDLSGKAWRENIYTYTKFLTPEEQAVCLSVRKDLPVKTDLFGGNDSCIRKIAVFGSAEELGYDFTSPICVIHIKPASDKFSEELSHRDYLGALMALGIERSLTGDIMTRGKEAWVYVLDTAAEFIKNELTQVGRNYVSCEIMTDDIPELEVRFQELKANIASERLDLIVSALAGLKRDDAAKLISNDRVFINGAMASRSGHRIKPGDTLVIRGCGKYIYDGPSGTTKKGRLNIKARKYI